VDAALDGFNRSTLQRATVIPFRFIGCQTWSAPQTRISLPDALDLGPQKLIAFRAGSVPRRIAKPCCITPVARRGNPQDLADRLDPEGVAMLIDEGLQDFRRRSSSAWAKNALASFRISLARRSSLTSRSSALRRSRSDVLTPSRSPLSTSSRLTQSSSVWLVQPIFGAID
jgi:hypothetical protein